MKAIVVEDDPSQAELVSAALSEMGYECDVSGDGQEGLMRLKSMDYDLAIIDIILPKLDGLEIIRAVRTVNEKLPIIVLSAKHTPDDIVNGLGAQADSYLAKPCTMPVLKEHVKALMRRAKRKEADENVSVGGIVLNRRKRTAFRNGRDLALSVFEFNLLELLMSNRGTVITYDRIKSEIWIGRPSVTNHNIAQSVEGLRFKVSEPGEEHSIIANKRGFGYVIE